MTVPIFPAYVTEDDDKGETGDIFGNEEVGDDYFAQEYMDSSSLRRAKWIDFWGIPMVRLLTHTISSLVPIILLVLILLVNDEANLVDEYNAVHGEGTFNNIPNVTLWGRHNLPRFHTSGNTARRLPLRKRVAREGLSARRPAPQAMEVLFYIMYMTRLLQEVEQIIRSGPAEYFSQQWNR